MMNPESVQRSDVLSSTTPGQSVVPTKQTKKIQAGGSAERASTVIQASVAEPHSYSRSAMDVLAKHATKFLEDTYNKNRPVVVYDGHGKILQKPDAEDFSDAIVMIRSGVNGQAFQLVAAPEGFTAPEDIGTPKEQRVEWGNGFRSAHIHPDHNSFFRALNVASKFDSNEDFRKQVIALDDHPAASKDIEDAMSIEPNHRLVRSEMAAWLKSENGAQALSELQVESSEPPRRRPQATVNRQAKVTDEEAALAKSYLKKSVLFSTERDSSIMRLFLPKRDSGLDRSLLEAFRERRSIPKNIKLNPMANGDVQVKFYPEGTSSRADGRVVGTFDGEEAVTKALMAMLDIKSAKDGQHAEELIDQADFLRDDVDRFKSDFIDDLVNIVDSNRHLAKSINKHFADEVIPSKIVPLSADEDPSAHYVGVRSVPIGNFFQGDYREMEEPQVNFLEIIKNPSPVKLPKGTDPVRVAVVGGGPSAAFLTFMYAKMASESERAIELDIFEASPDRNKLGRFDTAIFSDGTTGEHGAMRFPPSSTLFWDAVKEIVGEQGLATTFPNHHVSSSMFSLRGVEGSRGKQMGGAESSTYSKVLEPTIDFVLDKFSKISTVVDGKTITYQDIEDFLLNNPEDRTPNRAALMKKAFVQMCSEQNHTYGSFVENAIVEGIDSGELQVPPHFSHAYNNPGDETPGGAVAKKLLAQAEMAKFMDVGKGTGGWGSYSKMSVVQELITRSINSTEEFFINDIKKGNQDIGRLLRDRSREIGSENFSLNWQHGSRVVGLAKESFSKIDPVHPLAWLEFSDVDKKTGAETGSKHAKSYDCILTTSSPAVMQKVTAPQSGGSSERARISGIDENGKPIDKIMDKPFRVLAKSNAELDKIDPTLKENNSAVRKWMENASMFGTTKVWFQVSHEDYERLAPRDPNFVTTAEPRVQDVPAKWVMIPSDEREHYATSMELTPVGKELPVSAQFTIGNRSYEWVKISQDRFDKLPDEKPESEASPSGPRLLGMNTSLDDQVWLPITPDRLDNFDLTQEDVRQVYGSDAAVSTDGDQSFVWMPVRPKQADALTQDDPILQRLKAPTLSHQKAAAYVVDQSFFDAVGEDAPVDLDTSKLTPVTTRSGQPGFFYSVSLDQCEKFEKAIAEHPGLDIKTADDVPELGEIESVYKIRTTGESPDAYQIVGGTRNCYVIKNPEANTATILEYNWDNDGNKIQPVSGVRADSSVSNAHDLGHANSFLLGDEQNPLSELMGAAKEVSTRNFMRDPNLLGSFSMLGVGDAIRTLPVSEYYKHALNFKYNPELFSPATIIPTGENASLNPGWVNPALARSLEAFIASGVALGGTLESDAAECFMMKPPLIGDGKLSNYHYPSFGLASEIAADEAKVSPGV